MTRKDFDKYLNALQRSYDLTIKLDDLLSKADPDNAFFCFPPFNEMLELMEKSLGLEKGSYGYTTLSYYIFECDFGRNDREMLWNGKQVKLKSFEDVWNQIQREKG